MTVWQELVENDLGGYVSHCNRIDHQWIIDQLERDGFWEDYRENEIRQRYEEWCEIHTIQQYWTSFEDWCLNIIGTDWQTNYFWDFKQHLVNVILPRLSYSLELHIPKPQRDQGFSAEDLLHRLSDRLLTAVIYCCFSNSHWANLVENNPPPLTGQSSNANFSALFERIRYAALNTDGDGTAVLNFPDHEFDDTIVGCPIEFEGGSAEVDHSLAFIQSVDGHDVTLDTTIPTSTGLTVNIFYHPKHENAKSLVEGFADSYDSGNMKQRLNCLQHASIYVNESEYDQNTILWSQLTPSQATEHCDIYSLNFDNYPTSPPIATQATSSFAGNDYNYSTKMIAVQYEIIQRSEILDVHLPVLSSDIQENFDLTQADYDLMNRPNIQRLASRAVRLSESIHHSVGDTIVTASDGVNYTFTWTEYFGFSWIPTNQLESVDELKKPIPFLPPLPDNFSITDNLLGAERNYAYTGIRLGYDCVDIPGEGNRPSAITWHWGAGEGDDAGTLSELTSSLGPGASGAASANFGVGKAFHTYQGEPSGLMRYAPVDRVTNHSGVGVLRSIHGATADPIEWSATWGCYMHQRVNTADERSGRYVTSYNSVGVETCNIGYSRAGLPAQEDWPYIMDENGSSTHRIEPWTPEQIAMCIFLGRHIVNELPHIGMRHHHGHSDTCPTRKVDTVGFPFARILRCVYPDQIVPDVWTQFYFRYVRNNNNRTTTHSRQFALLYFGYDMGNSHDDNEPIQINGVDGQFGNTSKTRLESFKTDRNSYRQELRDGGNTNVPVDIHVDRDSPETNTNEYWCTFTCWEMHDALVSGWTMPND